MTRSARFLADRDLRIGLKDTVLRLKARPDWIIHDLAPTTRELRRPAIYLRSLWLWYQLRQASFTMLGCRRGRTLYGLAADAVRTGVPGDLVDCGVWNGG